MTQQLTSKLQELMQKRDAANAQIEALQIEITVNSIQIEALQTALQNEEKAKSEQATESQRAGEKKAGK